MGCQSLLLLLCYCQFLLLCLLVLVLCIEFLLYWVPRYFQSLCLPLGFIPYSLCSVEPDILECEVKWALESIITNKASEVMKFQLSYFKSWKMMLQKSCTQYASKFGKLSSGHRTGKGQFSFQSKRKAMPKNAQTTTQLHSSHMLVK